MKHKWLPRTGIFRIPTIVTVIALFTLIGCYSPLDRDESLALTVAIPWLSTSEIPDSGFGMDVYVYRATDVAIVDGNRFQVKRDAQSVPIGGKPFYRVLSPFDWTPSPGGGSVDARIQGVPAGGPYVLYILAWGNNGELDVIEYVSAVFQDGIELVQFSIMSGQETRLSSSQIMSLQF